MTISIQNVTTQPYAGNRCLSTRWSDAKKDQLVVSAIDTVVEHNTTRSSELLEVMLHDQIAETRERTAPTCFI